MAMQGLSSPAMARNQSRAASTHATKLALPAAHKTNTTVKSSQNGGAGGTAAPASAVVGSPRAFGGKKPDGSTLASAINRSQTNAPMPGKSNSGTAGKQPVAPGKGHVQGFSTGGAMKGIV